MRGYLVAGLIAAGLSTGALAEEQQGVEFQVTDLGGGVHMLVGRGGNIGLSVGEDGVFMIDDQFAPLTPQIEAEIGKLTESEVRFIVNTHYHGDHTGGNETWMGKGATVFAHENVRERMSKPGVSTYSGNKTDAMEPGLWPTVTFSENMTFYMNGQSVSVMHVPHAHTDGDSILFFDEADAIHMGDVFFHGGFPYIDLNGGGSVDGYIAAQEKVLAMIGDDTKIIPGHGALATKEDLAANVAMLKEARARVAKLVKEGKSLDEAIAAKPLADYDSFGGGFINTDKFVEFLHRGLSKAK